MNRKSRRTSVAAQKYSATELRNYRTFLLLQQFAAGEIGSRIRQARLEADGMTQLELAEALDVSTRQVQNYEAGETIPWKHFSRLEAIFGRDLSYWLRGEVSRPREDDVGQRTANHNAQRISALEDQAGRVEEALGEIHEQLQVLLQRARNG